MPGITLLGLGPGNIAQLTREAWDVLTSVDEIWLRTIHHPIVPDLPKSLRISSFDEYYENSESFDIVYHKIVERVLDLGSRSKGVVYAVPGAPFVAETTSIEIANRAEDAGLALRIINGVSFLEPVMAALGTDSLPQLSLVDALSMFDAYVPTFPADKPALIAQIYSRVIAAEVKMTLNAVFPDHHKVKYIHAAGMKGETIEELPLYKIDRSSHIGLLSVLYVPPIGEGASFEAFQEIVARLRGPDGCLWDREQTHSSLRPHLLEETYETLTALDSGDPEKLSEELGDLLLQIVLHAQIASDECTFNMVDVIKQIYDKVMARHPHVFGGLEVDGVDEVLRNWETIKEEERQTGVSSRNGLLDGVPLTMPALAQAQEYQDRAARIGFDWPDIEGVLEKIVEEIHELKQVRDSMEFENELGDLLFALVNLARWKKVDAESILRAANTKFKTRFACIEETARKQGKKLKDMTLDEMEKIWQHSKIEPES